MKLTKLAILILFVLMMVGCKEEVTTPYSPRVSNHHEAKMKAFNGDADAYSDLMDMYMDNRFEDALYISMKVADMYNYPEANLDAFLILSDDYPEDSLDLYTSKHRQDLAYHYLKRAYSQNYEPAKYYIHLLESPQKYCRETRYLDKRSRPLGVTVDSISMESIVFYKKKNILCKDYTSSINNPLYFLLKSGKSKIYYEDSHEQYISDSLLNYLYTTGMMIELDKGSDDVGVIGAFNYLKEICTSGEAQEKLGVYAKGLHICSFEDRTYIFLINQCRYRERSFNILHFMSNSDVERQFRIICDGNYRFFE